MSDLFSYIENAICFTDSSVFFVLFFCELEIFFRKSVKSHGSSKGTGSSKQNPAKVSRKTRVKVGKDVVFGTTGMTLAELGIVENYSFE